jgi:histone-lysine N-methyltransferase SETMAR
LKENLKEIHLGNVTNVVFFFHDNAPTPWSLATQKKLDYLGFQCLDHPPYSPNLAPSHYHLFLGLKNN